MILKDPVISFPELQFMYDMKAPELSTKLHIQKTKQSSHRNEDEYDHRKCSDIHVPTPLCCEEKG